MTTDRAVHQVRVQISVLPDDPSKCTGYGVDVRIMGEKDWRPIATEAFGQSEPVRLTASWAGQVAASAALAMPVVLPFE